MPRERPAPTNLHPSVAVCLLVALATVTWTIPPAVATHNSNGAGAHIVQADEAAQTGALQPDVPPTSSQRPVFHAELPEPRAPPLDQAGQRYTECTTAEEAGEGYDPSTREDHCYVGYLDAQLEYSLVQSPLAPQFENDRLYPVNPAPGDEGCTGESDPQDHPGPSVDDGGPVDQALARADRAVNDPACDGSGHEIFRTDEIAIDTDLLEAAQTEATPGASEGSGTLTLPLMVAEYVFLFGEPHEGNPDPSPFTAEDLFSADPGEGPIPLTALGPEDPCGPRTEDCRLLTPEDLRRYDRNAPPGSSGKARLCAFLPQDTVVEERTSDNRCGTTGRPVNAFFPDTRQGGLGIEEGPHTWMTTLPGWHTTGLIQVHEAHNGATATAQSYTEDTPRPSSGSPFVYAVNPEVPTQSHPLDCLRPGLLAQGDDSVLGIEDPGVYGPYQADAIDLDVYNHTARPVHAPLAAATHDTVRPLIASAEDVAEDGEPLEELDAAPLAQQAADRAFPLQRQPEEPQAQPGPQNERPFERTLDPGLSCDATGEIRALHEEDTIQGGLHVDAVVHGLPGGEDLAESYGVLERDILDPAPRDPTVTDEDGLPARESETEKGGWAPRTYSFHVQSDARLDTDGDGRFEGNCIVATEAELTGAPQDPCVWTGIWDAYNGNCVERGVSCDEILEDFGYDVYGEGKGVGLYFVLRVTGPTLITPWTNGFFHETCCIGTDYGEEYTRAVGFEDPTAQNCIVGSSVGFAEKLRERWDADILDRLCQGSDGERIHIEDAMFRQFGLESPPANAKIQWTPLLPRPDAVQTTTSLGAGDELCVNLDWHVKPDVDVTEDTRGNIELGPASDLGPGSDHYVFTDCDPLGADRHR